MVGMIVDINGRPINTNSMRAIILGERCGGGDRKYAIGLENLIDNFERAASKAVTQLMAKLEYRSYKCSFSNISKEFI